MVTPDGPDIPPGFVRLIGRTWSLQPGQLDTYRCVRVTVPTDTYITDFLAQAPLGTHHTVLTLATGQASGADGEFDCSVGTLGTEMMFASGVGTPELAFPDGVGIKIAAGTRINLNLHLFNATDNPIQGDSAILVKSSATAPPTIAEMVFGGTLAISIPSNNQPTNFTGTCTAQTAYSLFAIWPHMHQIATHQKVDLTHNGTTNTIYDMPYMFAEQKYWPQSPEIQVAAGDKITTTCTYVNNTGHTVTFGESSNDEMCFTGLYRYPAANSGTFCQQ
jgi:copper type II ascorbate-dependent monooxygenase-like protein